MLKFSLRNLLTRPLRTALSLLGLTVAIMGMVGLFSVAHGLDRTVSRTFGQIPGLAAMQPGAPIPLFSTLPEAWGDDIAKVEGVDRVLPEIFRRVNVINRKMIFSPPRLLYGSDIAVRIELRKNLFREKIEKGGRYFQKDDIDSDRCIISRPIADEFDVAVGDSIEVNGHWLEIIGIYHAKSLMVDVNILVDIRTVRRMTGFKSDSVSSFYIEQAPGVDKDDLVERIRYAFRDRTSRVWTPASLGLGSGGNPVQEFFGGLDRLIKGIAGGRQSLAVPGPAKKSSSASPPKNVHPDFQVAPDLPIEVRTAQDWGERFDRFADDLDLVLAVLTAIGVTIAVLSITNTMVMSVTERMIEFGILKANGWSQWDVLKLVTFESAVIGFSGGFLGCLLGWIGTQFVNWKWADRIELYAGPGLLVFGLVFATALGVLGGLYPAIRAMRMMPMDAIRRG